MNFPVGQFFRGEVKWYFREGWALLAAPLGSSSTAVIVGSNRVWKLLFLSKEASYLDSVLDNCHEQKRVWLSFDVLIDSVKSHCSRSSWRFWIVDNGSSNSERFAAEVLIFEIIDDFTDLVHVAINKDIVDSFRENGLLPLKSIFRTWFCRLKTYIFDFDLS